VPAVVNELDKQGLIRKAITANGKTLAENCKGREIEDKDVIRSYADPLVKDAGFVVLKGNLFDSAIMKTSVISPEFRARYPPTRNRRTPSRAAPSSSRAPRTITTASTIPPSTSTKTRCCSSAAPARSATPAVPRS
jgi:hypothetical protein